jgi:gamma-glutamylcyclotransferase (GGCT)/AIG2-like uncharacterized protein YtfP
MNTMKRLYLAYGSNLNMKQMSTRCPTAKAVGVTCLKDRRLLFRGRRELAVATVEPYKGSSVPALVWSLEPRDERTLDRYEGYPSFYRKEETEVELDTENATVMLYVMNEGRPLGQPSASYYATILEGYTTAGFDIGILHQATADSYGDTLWTE